MDFFTDIETRVASMRDLLGDVDVASALPWSVEECDDAAVVRLLEIAGGVAHMIDQVRLAASGMIARRSTRDAGHTGLAQVRGHRNAVSLVQQLGGATRAEASRQVRVGESLFEEPESRSATVRFSREESDGSTGDGAEEPVGAGGSGTPEGPEDAAGPDGAVSGIWHDPLRRALYDGRLTAAKHDAIRRGLGEPPKDGANSSRVSAEPSNVGDDRRDDQNDQNESHVENVVAAWSGAAEQLVAEVEHCSVEELAKTARIVRDRLDPEGAEVRYLARFEARSFRMWTDRDGLQRGSLVFDDESAVWVRAVTDAALRPRRGGPRFVDPDERRRASELAADPRTNDQLAFDLILDVLKSGAVAEAKEVFGTREAGVRVVTVLRAAEGTRSSDKLSVDAHFEDGGTPLPVWAARQRICNSGIVPVTVDGEGNPLNMGRKRRLFTADQRIALAARDGGCRWRFCDRPASYCEAHHIDEWDADGGRTDIDRGILLCAYHHMHLHNGGWRITREGIGDFVLHDPSGGTTTLPPRLGLTYAWAGVDPPPKRFRLAA